MALRFEILELESERRERERSLYRQSLESVSLLAARSLQAPLLELQPSSRAILICVELPLLFDCNCQ